MNNRIQWVLGLVIAVVSVAIIAAGLLRDKPAPQAHEPSGSFGGLSQTDVYATPSEQQPGGSASATVLLQDGSTLAVKDFLSGPDTSADANNPGNYYIGNSIDPGSPDAPSVPYVISYVSASSFFSITILQEPIDSVRAQAEQYLMRTLGISEGDMCRLRYTLVVPVRVNQVYGGENLGFSFCEGATRL